MKYKRRSTGEEKVQKIAAGEEGNYRMERVPLKQTDRHHKSPGGDLCIRDSSYRGHREGTPVVPVPRCLWAVHRVR
ncbi:hypothetical protein A9S67_17605 [Salmonella enterica subsp. enterica serovar Hadar]|nr:hypothetical protein [Salmonella enterica subsp. enterica serovar Hadar]